jgi:hypothetical protein
MAFAESAAAQRALRGSVAEMLDVPLARVSVLLEAADSTRVNVSFTVSLPAGRDSEEAAGSLRGLSPAEVTYVCLTHMLEYDPSLARDFTIKVDSVSAKRVSYEVAHAPPPPPANKETLLYSAAEFVSVSLLTMLLRIDER